MSRQVPHPGRIYGSMMKLVWVLLAIVISQSIFSQKLTTTINKEKIVIGEQVQVQVKVEDVAASEIIRDFEFPDSINHIEILSHQVDNAGSTVIHQLLITSFDPGQWQLPAFEMTLSGNRTLKSEPLPLTVLPVDVSGLADYHDIKDVQDVPLENNWWIIVTLVILALLALFALLWVLQHKPVTAVKKVQVSSPGELYRELISRIKALQEDLPSGRMEIKQVYTELYNSARLFSDASFQQDTAHYTTGEYMLVFKGIDDKALQTKYFQFLRMADAVKFAKFHPAAGETKEMLQHLESFITGIYQQSKIANA